MKDYITLFQTHEQYADFTETDDFVLPNVSHCIAENDVHYNPIRNDMIIYYSNSKLNHTTGDTSLGLHTTSFYPATIVSHTFKDGVGKITFDRDITQIGNYAFRGCSSLTGIEIPRTVTYIGQYAFSTCDLYSIKIPFQVQNIGGAAFVRNTHLEEFICPNGLKTIGTHAFEDCERMKYILIPNNVTSIGEGAFQNCYALDNVNISTSMTTLSRQVFLNCRSITHITIPNNITTIGEQAFSGCRSLDSIYIPNTVTSIDNFAFENCISLASANIPENITSVGGYWFDNCKSLKEITIPSGVTFFNYGTFRNCNNLDTIYALPTTAPRIQTLTFQNVKEGGTLYIPAGSNYSTWMSTGNYYLGLYNWTVVEQ